MIMIKKVVLIIFSCFYINSLFFQSFANDSHHFFDTKNIESTCNTQDGCCNSTADECMTKCIPWNEILTSSYKSIKEYSHIFQHTSISFSIRKANFQYNNSMYFKKTYIDRNLFIISYVGKQKITW